MAIISFVSRISELKMQTSSQEPLEHQHSLVLRRDMFESEEKTQMLLLVNCILQTDHCIEKSRTSDGLPQLKHHHWLMLKNRLDKIVQVYVASGKYVKNDLKQLRSAVKTVLETVNHET